MTLRPISGLLWVVEGDEQNKPQQQTQGSVRQHMPSARHQQLGTMQPPLQVLPGKDA